MGDHVLLLLRHAKAEDFVPGAADDQRPLSPRGRAQASAVAEALRGTTIDHVLCSPSTRTRQTLEPIGVAGSVDYAETIYQAGSQTILDELAGLPEDAVTVLVVGHAPGIPALAHDLADQAGSGAAALDQIASGYPPATLVRLEFDGTWGGLSAGAACLTEATVRR